MIPVPGNPVRVASCRTCGELEARHLVYLSYRREERGWVDIWGMAIHQPGHVVPDEDGPTGWDRIEPQPGAAELKTLRSAGKLSEGHLYLCRPCRMAAEVLEAAEDIA